MKQANFSDAQKYENGINRFNRDSEKKHNMFMFCFCYLFLLRGWKIIRIKKFIKRMESVYHEREET